jgi:hypothetical protein
MDILDLMAQMEKYGQIVAFAPHYYNSDNTVVVVKLDICDNMGNGFYVVIWDPEDRTDKVTHSSQTWMNAAESFRNISDLI